MLEESIVVIDKRIRFLEVFPRGVEKAKIVANRLEQNLSLFESFNSWNTVAHTAP